MPLPVPPPPLLRQAVLHVAHLPLSISSLEDSAANLLFILQVCEIFGVSPEQLQPASRRELLAALLGELRDAHWAAAAGCSASPAAMVPLAVDTALANKVRGR